jgi:hypothetical protein
MEWTRNRSEEDLVEWTRADGYVTIRRRRRADGGWIVRLDRLYQAPEGSGYRRERVDDAESAERLVEAWKDEHGAAEEQSST